MALFTLEQSQKIPASLETVWDFITSPQNLKRITPPYMGFDIVTPNLPEKIHPGMLIEYRVSPLLNLKMRWVTEITHVKELSYFVDEQRIGPYSIWHHQHHISEVEGGVMMNDRVDYQPPFGFLGNIANSLIIKKQLNEIFDFRVKALEKIFGKPT